MTETYTQEELNAVMAAHNEHADERVARARSSLAIKVLETVEARADPENTQWDAAIDACSTALRDLFQREGIELQPKQIQES